MEIPCAVNLEDSERETECVNVCVRVCMHVCMCVHVYKVMPAWPGVFEILLKALPEGCSSVGAVLAWHA